MRRFSAVLAVLGLSAVALVACSTSDDPAASCPRPAEVGDAASLVELSDTGSLENVSVTPPVYTDEVSYHDVVRGDGEPLVSANQESRSIPPYTTARPAKRQPTRDTTRKPRRS